MSDDFNKNDYDDYFKKLDNRLKEKYSVNSIVSNEDKLKLSVKKKTKKKIYAVIKIKPIIVIIIVFALIVSIFGVIKISKLNKKNSSETESIKRAQDSESNIPSDKSKLSFQLSPNASDIPLSNDAGGAIVVDLKSKEIVASRNCGNKFFPASTTKIMTLLTAIDYIENYNDTFTMTSEITDPLYVQDATVAGFLDGEVINMTDLLYSIILPSGADACMAVAIKISGSEKEFVKLMNKKSMELGLKNTNFVNTTGLFDENHYTTPYDMAVILNSAIENPICKKILSTYQYTTAKTSQHPDGILLTSTLFSSMYGTEPETATISGGKTGFVNESRYCIASFGYNNTTQNEYLVVTFKNSSKWPAIHGQIEIYKEYAK